MTGEQIKKARKSRGWTQTQLAEELSKLFGRPVTQSEVSLWEKGQREPQAATTVLLSQVLTQPTERDTKMIGIMKRAPLTPEQAAETQEALAALEPLADLVPNQQRSEALYAAVQAEWMQRAEAHRAGERSPEHIRRYHVLSIQKWILAIATGRDDWMMDRLGRTPQADRDPALQEALDLVATARQAVR